MLKLTDHCAINFDAASKVRETQDGYLVAMPRVARTGIQLYRGSEVGVKDKAIVRIFRPEDQVFNTDSMHSFAYKPITNDHPPEPVNCDNWSKYAKGQIGDEIARDGDFIRVPMVLMDGTTIRAARDGKVELSVGYTCELEMKPGITADGQEYDGIQKNINVNHVAFVDAARAGHMARFGDGSGECRVDFAEYAAAMNAVVSSKLVDGVFDTSSNHANSGFLGVSKKYPVMRDGCLNLMAARAVITDSIAKGDGDITAAAKSLIAMVDSKGAAPRIEEKTIMPKHLIDGISVEMDDTAHQVVTRTIKGLQDTIESLKATAASVTTDHAKVLADKDGQIAKLTTDLTAATTKVTTLETQVKDAAMTPEKLEALVRDRSTMIAKAKAVLPQVVVDGKADGDIRKQVVDAKLGDAAKGWSDDQVKVSFDTLTAGVDLSNIHTPAHGVADLAASFSQPGAPSMQDAYTKRNKSLEDAWKGPQHRAN